MPVLTVAVPLHPLPALHFIPLALDCFPSAGVVAMSKALQANSALLELNLGAMGLGESPVDSRLSGLLRRLRCHCIPVADPLLWCAGASKDGIKALAQMLRTNK